jgi:hydroxyacylglutathione hydrolase
MIIRNFYNDKLAAATYLVGCGATGEAILIDPLRNIAPYLQKAKDEGLRIVAVTETHIHADFLSGLRQVVAETGATGYLSDEGDSDWKYAFAGETGMKLVKHGDKILVGNLSLEVIHTPGHTPEHISFLLVDHPAGDTPHSLFTGDFIFAGDVGRPDLLERAAHVVGTMEKGARVLYNSIKETSELPDSLLIWPAHGAGSACGKSLGGSPVTSLGYERKTNWAFQIHDVDEFVKNILEGQPEPPKYFKEMKRLNKLGPSILSDKVNIPELSSENECRFAGSGVQWIDSRKATTCRKGHKKDALVIPQSKNFITWVGWLLEYELPIGLVVDNGDSVAEVVTDLQSIGLDHVVGWIQGSELDNQSTVAIQEITCQDIQSTDTVLDVRGLGEWLKVHMSESIHIPLGYVKDRAQEIPRNQRLVVHCASGGRSPIAVSLLQQLGYDDVVELQGGMNAVQSNCPQLIAIK